MRRSIVALIVLALLPLVLNLSGGTPTSLAFRFTRQSGPLVEPVAAWMVANAVAKAFDALRGVVATREEVVAYFSLAGRASRISQVVWQPARATSSQPAALSAELLPLQSELDGLRPGVESLIQRQVAAALHETGLDPRPAGTEVPFPPLFFRFEALPKLLVVSPRAKIDRAGTVLLRPDLTLEDAEKLERDVSDRQFSALVTQIGGLGVYPSMVPESADIRGTLRTVAHEWAHQSLAFRPLGWRYAFGGERDARMVTINETVAEMLGREIGDRVYGQYYAGPQPPATAESPGDSVFRSMMRDIRVRVDALLARGRIEAAEDLMETSRVELAQKGYNIRKLNQAYFAFYGSYADQPALAGGVGEDIGGRLHALRDRSVSLGDFLWEISSAGSFDEFLKVAPLP